MVYNWLINRLSRFSDTHCLLCSAPIIQTTEFCPACWQDLPRLRFRCPQCGDELASESALPCGHCQKQASAFDRVIASFAYDLPIRQLISRYKYLGQLSLAQPLASSLLKSVQEQATNVEAILPVPLHNKRLRERGFNQAVELARPLASQLGIPILLKEVKRQRFTEVQSTLSARQREQNLRGAFTITRPLRQRRLAIVDDVMTTGSTADELARLLKENGADYVEVWCVARASVMGHTKKA